MYGRGILSRRRRIDQTGLRVAAGSPIEKLYQNDFVTALAVDQLIGNLFHEQNAKTAGPHPHIIAKLRVAERLLGWVADCGMRDGIE